MPITDLSAESLGALEFGEGGKLVIQVPASMSAADVAALRATARGAVGPAVKITVMTGGDDAPVDAPVAYVHDPAP